MEKTMTEGKEWKLILLFTLPLMAGNLLQQLYNAVDGIIVGNFVGEAALAAVGTCSPLSLLFIAIAIGMSSGASIVISQFYGAGQMDEMRRSVSTSLVLMLGLGAALSLLGVVGARWFLAVVLGVQDYLLADAVLYFRIYALGLIFQFIYNIVSAVLRSLGNSKATLYFLLISSICNVILDLVVVLLLGWGVMGVAVATVFSQALSAVAGLVYLVRNYPELRFAKDQFKFDRETGRLVLKMGIPSMLQQCVLSLSHMAIQRVVNAFDITAGYTAAIRIEDFIVIPITCYFIGLATFTGQNLGAKKLERVRRGLRGTIVMTVITVVIVCAIVLIGAPWLVSRFGVAGASKTAAVSYLHCVGIFFLLFGLYFCYNGVLQGAGDVIFTAFNTFSSLALRVVLAYVMAFCTPLGWNAIGYSLVISWVYNVALAFLRYRFGPWKRKGVVAAE